MNSKLAYFAGLIDGEGCITIKRSNPRGNQRTPTYVFSFCLEMADPRPVKALCDYFGLKLNYNTSRHRKNPSKHRYLYVAQCGRQAGIGVLLLVLPYLKAKKTEAKVAIEFYERCFPNHLTEGRNRKPVPEHIIALRHKYYLKLRKLKVRKFLKWRKRHLPEPPVLNG